MGKFIPKITNFGGCKPSPHFKSDWWNLAWGYGPGTPTPHLLL